MSQVGTQEWAEGIRREFRDAGHRVPRSTQTEAVNLSKVDTRFSDVPVPVDVAEALFHGRIDIPRIPKRFLSEAFAGSVEEQEVQLTQENLRQRELAARFGGELLVPA